MRKSIGADDVAAELPSDEELAAELESLLAEELDQAPVADDRESDERPLAGQPS